MTELLDNSTNKPILIETWFDVFIAEFMMNKDPEKGISFEKATDTAWKVVEIVRKGYLSPEDKEYVEEFNGLFPESSIGFTFRSA